MGVVRSLAEATPQLTRSISGVINTVAEAAPALLKAGLCNVVCPISGQEQCKKDHCQETETVDGVQPRASKNLDDDETETDYYQAVVVEA